MSLMKVGEQPTRRGRTCVLMGKLAGLVVPAAFRGQPVDEVILVESIPHSGKKQIVEVPGGLDVGLGVPERESVQKRLELRELLTWRGSGSLGGGFLSQWGQAALRHCHFCLSL